MAAPAPRRPAWWPTEAEIELLRAIFGDESAGAAEVWRRLYGAGGLERLGADAVRLAPQLYERLCAAGVSGPELLPLRRAYAETRSVNAATRRHAREALERLASRGVAPMLLKGLAFDALAGATGSRRIGDLDLMVRRGELRTALAALREGGWEAIESESPGALDAKHSTCLRRPDTAEIDLHWVLGGRLAVHRDLEVAMRPFWERARRIEYLGLRAWLLHPMDQVLHLVVHGAFVESRARARWLADVRLLLGMRAPEPADWRLLVASARELRSTTQVAAAFRCFEHVFPGMLPESLHEELGKGRRTISERLLWTLDSRTVRRPLALDVVRTLRSHLSNQRGRPLPVALLLYPSYLVANGYVASPLQLARHVARRRRERRASSASDGPGR
jgi:hypothetical protein